MKKISIIFAILYCFMLSGCDKEEVNPPLPPNSIEITDAGLDFAVISWTPIDGATGYNIYLNNIRYNEFPVENVSYTIQRLKMNTEYTITVTAINGSAESDKTSNRTFKTPDVTVRIEAESITPQAPMSIVDDATASGGKFIWWDNNNVLSIFNPTTPIVVYNFTIYQEGAYTIWLKTQSPSPDGDSYFGRVNGKNLLGTGTDWTRIFLGPGVNDPNNPVYGKWEWLPLNNASWVTPIVFQFTAGNHTLEICPREQRSKLDKIMIKQGNAKPTEN